LEVQQLLDFQPLNNSQLDLQGSVQVVVQGELHVLPHALSQPLPNRHPLNNEPQPLSQALPHPPKRLKKEPQPLSQPMPQPP
jgi:hypothetical protein